MANMQSAAPEGRRVEETVRGGASSSGLANIGLGQPWRGPPDPGALYGTAVHGGLTGGPFRPCCFPSPTPEARGSPPTRLVGGRNRRAVAVLTAGCQAEPKLVTSRRAQRRCVHRGGSNRAPRGLRERIPLPHASCNPRLRRRSGARQCMCLPRTGGGSGAHPMAGARAAPKRGRGSTPCQMALPARHAIAPVAPRPIRP